MQLPYHVYEWMEAVDTQDVLNGTNHRLKRVSCDILMCGPTTLEQVKAGINLGQDHLKVTITLPKTFVSERRTAVRARDAGQLANRVAPAAVHGVIDRAHGLTRVQAHKDCLIEYKKKTKNQVELDIPLGCKVDKLFCRRDDFGRDNGNARGLAVATYQHEDLIMQAANQYIYILHVEMTAAEREETEMRSPSNLSTFHDFA